MTPNLFLATQRVFSPHKWFKSSKSERMVRQTEFWEDGPVPGLYEYIPGRGRYLIATLKDAPTDVADLKTTEGGPVLPASSPQPREYVQLERPIPITYSRAVKRWFLDPDFKVRKKYGTITNDRGKRVEVGFFRTDDHGGVAWVQCWDEEGTFIPGPYQKWCIDTESKQFRHMRKRDDPNYVHSRSNSSNRDADTHSQDSMSTEIRSSRPGSTKNGLSVPSTRANSIRYLPSTSTSRPSSLRPSRQSSPKRNNSIPLEEAKASLRRMAREHEEAVAAAAAAGLRTESKDRVERIERGRPTARVGS
ncbi:Nn.00g104520.m01.CDS01 [Neocucurbitaria sp. VM-36]